MRRVSITPSHHLSRFAPRDRRRSSNGRSRDADNIHRRNLETRLTVSACERENVLLRVAALTSLAVSFFFCHFLYRISVDRILRSNRDIILHPVTVSTSFSQVPRNQSLLSSSLTSAPLFSSLDAHLSLTTPLIDSTLNFESIKNSTGNNTKLAPSWARVRSDRCVW